MATIAGWLDYAVPDELPILDYAPPPEPLLRRSIKYIRKSRLFWFVVFRPLRAVEVGIGCWTFVCASNIIFGLLCHYRLLENRGAYTVYDDRQLFRLTSTEGIGIALLVAGFAALMRLVIRRRWKVALLTFLVFAILSSVSGLVQLKVRRTASWLQIFGTSIPLQSQKNPGVYDGIWWIDRLPGWPAY